MDLISVLTTVAEDNPRAARALMTRIRRAVRQPGRHPRSGRMIPEFGEPSLRERIVPPYRVLYAVGEDVVVLGIHHSRQPLVVDPTSR